MNFDKAIEFILKFEGGYVNDPQDPGGETKYGISKKAYPKLNIKDLSLNEAKKIYESNYWLASKASELKDELQLIHFDTSVNMGNHRAVKILQSASGATIDGIFGSETKSKSDKISVERYALERMFHYCEIIRNNQMLIKYIVGWKNRVMDIVNYEKRGDKIN